MFKNGSSYEGQWKNGVRFGQGQQIWPNGSSYFGEWKDNQANGKGKMKHFSG